MNLIPLLQTSAGGQYMFFVTLGLVFLIFYVLLIRPQKKEQKEREALIATVKKGDKIITNGGLICEVIKAENDFIKVKLNDDVIVRIAREFVAKKIEDK